MRYKCDKCGEPQNILILADTNLAYARLSSQSLSQTSVCYHPGHTLVLPKRHVEDRAELTSEEILELHNLTTRVAKALQIRFGYRSIGILEFHGTRSTPHLHTHVIPGDPPYAIELDVKGAHKLDIDELDDLTAKLRVHL